EPAAKQRVRRRQMKKLQQAGSLEPAILPRGFPDQVLRAKRSRTELRGEPGADSLEQPIHAEKTGDPPGFQPRVMGFQVTTERTRAIVDAKEKLGERPRRSLRRSPARLLQGRQDTLVVGPLQ